MYARNFLRFKLAPLRHPTRETVRYLTNNQPPSHSALLSLAIFFLPLFFAFFSLHLRREVDYAKRATYTTLHTYLSAKCFFTRASQRTSVPLAARSKRGRANVASRSFRLSRNTVTAI